MAEINDSLLLSLWLTSTVSCLPQKLEIAPAAVLLRTMSVPYLTLLWPPCVADADITF